MSLQPVMREVRISVFEHLEDLEAAVEKQRKLLLKDGFVEHDPFYEFDWLVPSEDSFEARFKKLRATPDGAPALVATVKADAENAVFGFVVLNFGPMHEAVKARLAELEVGGTVGFRFKVG